jgi:diguanylate cyclase (GGDEF)-like protein
MPYQSEDGKWIVAEVNVDISERKKIEDELAKYRDHLEDMVKERTNELLEEISEHKQSRHKISMLAQNLSSSNKRFKKLSLTDSQTGLYNHRYLGEVIEAEFHRARRYAHNLTIIMLDIDYFKSINDVYGHQFGDLVLKQFAAELKKMLRKYDIVIRYGGEEFLVISPGINRQQALVLSQRILESLNLHSFGNKKHFVKLKISIGIVSYPEDNNTNCGMDLVNMADQVLNKAKESGGNRVYLLSDIKNNAGGILGKKEKSPDIKILKSKIEKLNKRANQSLAEAILAFAKTIELKDHYTGEHVELTSHYATLIANKIGLPRDEVELIRQASILHDLGKIGISEKILLKKSKLTKKEFEEIKKHPQIGADILRPIHFLPGLIPIIFYHHERWDGKGYPTGIKGEEIPIGARIIALADVYQALTSDRPYRKAYPKAKAVKIIKSGSGTQFDPTITEIFLDILKDQK